MYFSLRHRRRVLLTVHSVRAQRNLPQSRTDMPSVAIVGAGLAGLVAAYELSKQGFDVMIFEAEALLLDRPPSLAANGASQAI